MRQAARMMAAACLIGLLVAACSGTPRGEPRNHADCRDSPSHVQTRGEAGMGYHSEDGFLSKVSLEIGMHSRPRTTCPDRRSGTRLGSTLTLAQDN